MAAVGAFDETQREEEFSISMGQRDYLQMLLEIA